MLKNRFAAKGSAGTESAPLRPMPVWKKTMFSALMCAGFLGLLEGVPRLLLGPNMADVYLEHCQTISVLGLPALNETMEDDPHLFWRLRDRLENLRVRGKIREGAMDFVVNTRDGLRSPPVRPKKDRFRILALGDSCTFGVGVNDTETWPAQLQQLYEARGIAVEVINAGVPGYTAFQGLRYLERYGLALQPDLVVACFGFNDRDTWASRSDYDTARAIAWNYRLSVFNHSRFISLMRRLTASPPPADSSRSMRMPRLTRGEFNESLGNLKRLCDKREIHFVLAVWPFEIQLQKRWLELESYQMTAVQFAAEEAVPVINLVDAFRTAEAGELFVDQVHANRQGCRVAAEAIGRCLAPLVP